MKRGGGEASGDGVKRGGGEASGDGVKRGGGEASGDGVKRGGGEASGDGVKRGGGEGERSEGSGGAEKWPEAMPKVERSLDQNKNHNTTSRASHQCLKIFSLYQNSALFKLQKTQFAVLALHVCACGR